MPYVLTKKGNKYAVMTVATGKTHGWTSKVKAEAQMRILKQVGK